jgi:hypothetical protein
MTAKMPAGEKTPVIPTHEVKVLQLFVCSSIRRFARKIGKNTIYSSPRDHWVGERD